MRPGFPGNLFPHVSGRAWAVWRRNLLVWRKMAITTVLGNLADPMIYLFGLGYGLGALIPTIGGTSYMTYLAAGMVCASTMNSASFEATYGAFSRLDQQRTWEAIINAPVSLDDVVAGEWLWAGAKATLSGLSILAVVSTLGYVASPWALAALPAIFLTGLCFAALGLIFTALAPAYDFFMYWFTLFITPMLLLSGVFFPADQLPAWIQSLSWLLPLSHAVQIVRPLLAGTLPTDLGIHSAALILITGGAFWIAVLLARRRLLR